MVSFLCYNYLTLAKAIYYCQNSYRDDDDILIMYRETVTLLPELQLDKIKLQIVHGSDKNNARRSRIAAKLSVLINVIRMNIRTRTTVRMLLNRYSPDCINTIVLFKDVGFDEATLLDTLLRRKKLKKRFHVVMIEEGLAVYSSATNPEKKHSLLRLANTIMGVSNYSLDRLAHGLHPAIDSIICSDPERLRSLHPELASKIDREDSIFTHEFSEYFCRLMLGDKTDIFDSLKNCGAVLLTQPLIGTYGVIKERYLKTISDVLNVFSKKTVVLIKKHPRDHLDYSEFIKKNIVLCPEPVNSLPYEALYAAIGKPLNITFFSSAATNCGSEAQTVFVYKLLGSAEMNEKLRSIICCSDNAFIPETLDELKHHISGYTVK